MVARHEPTSHLLNLAQADLTANIPGTGRPHSYYYLARPNLTAFAPGTDRPHSYYSWHGPTSKVLQLARTDLTATTAWHRPTSQLLLPGTDRLQSYYYLAQADVTATTAWHIPTSHLPLTTWHRTGRNSHKLLTSRVDSFNCEIAQPYDKLE